MGNYQKKQLQSKLDMQRLLRWRCHTTDIELTCHHTKLESLVDHDRRKKESVEHAINSVENYLADPTTFDNENPIQITILECLFDNKHRTESTPLEYPAYIKHIRFYPPIERTITGLILNVAGFFESLKIPDTAVIEVEISILIINDKNGNCRTSLFWAYISKTQIKEILTCFAYSPQKLLELAEWSQKFNPRIRENIRKSIVEAKAEYIKEHREKLLSSEHDKDKIKLIQEFEIDLSDRQHQILKEIILENKIVWWLQSYPPICSVCNCHHEGTKEYNSCIESLPLEIQVDSHLCEFEKLFQDIYDNAPSNVSRLIGHHCYSVNEGWRWEAETCHYISNVFRILLLAVSNDLDGVVTEKT